MQILWQLYLHSNTVYYSPTANPPPKQLSKDDEELSGDKEEEEEKYYADSYERERWNPLTNHNDGRLDGWYCWWLVAGDDDNEEETKKCDIKMACS